MHIEHPHALGEEEAVRRIDRFLDDLMRCEPPAGVRITSPWKSWNGNVMDFSFNAGKGFFSATISGTMVVTGDRVEFDTELPALIRSFVGEEMIAGVVRRELGRILAGIRTESP